MSPFPNCLPVYVHPFVNETMLRKVLTLLLILGLLATPMTANAVMDDPRFVTYVPNETLTPGQTNQLAVLIQNIPEDADDVSLQANNTTVRVESGGTPFTVMSGTTYIGRMGHNQIRNVTARVRVPDGTPAGTYRIPLRIEYSYLDENDPGTRADDRQREVETTVYATVRVEERPRFAVEETASNVGVGGTGEVTVTVTNVGEENVSNAAVSLQSNVPDVTFNGAQSTRRFVGNWDAGETKTLTYKVRAASSAEPRSYALTGTVSYENENGVQGQSNELTVGVQPSPKGSFAIRDVQSTLRVGEEGEVSGTVLNTGDSPIRNAVVVFGNTSPTVTPVETEYAVGTIQPGQRANFSFDTEVSSDAEPGPRQFDMRLRYRSPDDDLITSDQKDVRVQVRQETPEFDVQPVNATLSTGSDGEFQLRVTNTRDQPLTDISAKIYAEEPLSTSDSEAFVKRLGPGEAKTVSFGLSASGSALEKTYPLKLDFQYDNAQGETKISDTYQVPVQVTNESNGSLSLPLVLGAALLVGLVVAGYLYVRRD